MYKSIIIIIRMNNELPFMFSDYIEFIVNIKIYLETTSLLHEEEQKPIICFSAPFTLNTRDHSPLPCSL